MCGFGGRTYLLTAKHLVKAESIRNLFILPFQSASKPLSFDKHWPVQAVDENGIEDEGSDLMPLRIDTAWMTKTDRDQTNIIKFDTETDWFSTRHTSFFFLFGYPKDKNYVDYESRELVTAQQFIAGRYITRDEYSGYTHRLAIQHSIASDFQGLSGSPVMSFTSPGTNTVPGLKFCGMALRGGVESGIIHFLDARSIIGILTDIDNEDRIPGLHKISTSKRSSPFISRRRSLLAPSC